MYAAVTGLSALSTGMQVISNNIANVNTVGFKAARTNFEDLISQDYWSNGKIQQIGRGVKVASVQQMFSQGAFINSEQDTDMAIAGEGFFQVRDRVTGTLMYTRAGNFTFDSEGVLETPSGYVLQGWALSIPKPGDDPVREGELTDVKVIVLNAPPVATSQIKAVVNLNADDTSAYIYSSAEFATLYADQKARGPAESARLIAADLVYNFERDTSAYPDNSSAFTRAYESYLSGLGYVLIAPGVFEKVTSAYPTANEIKQAHTSALNASSAYLMATGIYPETSNSTTYNVNYNSAYSHYLINERGYTENPIGTFSKTSAFPALQSDLNTAAFLARSAAQAVDPSFTNYPSTTNAAANAAYEAEYVSYLVSLDYIAPVPDYETTPNPSEVGAANAVGIAVAKNDVDQAIAAYPTGSVIGDLAYIAGFAKSMASSGYSLDPAFSLPGIPALNPEPTATELSDALAAGEAAAVAADPFYVANTGYAPGSNTVLANLAYLAGYTEHLAGLGYTLDGSYGIPTIPTYSGVTDPDWYTAAETAALQSAKNNVDPTMTTFPSSNLAANVVYVAEHAKNMLSNAGTAIATPPYTIPAALPLQGDFKKEPDSSQLAAAELAGVTAAQAVDENFLTYNTSTNAEARLNYIYAYTLSLTTAGFNIDSTYPLPSSLPNYANFQDGTSFTRFANETEKNTANKAAIEAAVLAGAPANYTYPADNTTWDTAYLNAYASNMPAGFTATPALTGFTKVTTENPTAAEIATAKSRGKAAAEASVGYPLSYPAVSSDATLKATYDSVYEAEMVTTLGYTKIVGDPYFEKTKIENPSSTELLTAATVAKAAATAEAANKGQAAYDLAYSIETANALLQLEQLGFAPWELEGMGFAGAWDGTDLDSPIDPENYTHSNPWTIYDSLGTAHTLMIYYQPNPYMENVWDYIITCDPTEDARKDSNYNLFMEGASFAGLIQKGKITFTADGEDRHGGVIKDIEAQNLDISLTKAAFFSSASANCVNPATASSINFVKVGGYYEGEPMYSATTRSLVATKREYTITWVGNLNTVPQVSGFEWVDTDGNTGTLPIHDKNYTGPYSFGSGLTLNFSDGGTPMRFTKTDSFTVIANSEAIGWTNLTPNEEGYFDFDVVFVQSASLALHPPYDNLTFPTITQTINLDMGARNPNGQLDEWILDDQGTTQYASKSINIFSSQDGYPAGSLQRVSIDKDGILTGIYTNGRQQPLYQIGLARFLNPWGLEKLGDNVYMQTRWSGEATINPPGYGGTGTIRANFLEQSNTDLADEIVNMIVTQRGFQANSKVVTTTDTMLAEVIEMKR
jgi:flagellar hook-basal body protein